MSESYQMPDNPFVSYLTAFGEPVFPIRDIIWFNRWQGDKTTMFSEFKKFIMRGNVVDLAVAVVIGAAFGAVVTALVKDFVTPLIAAIGGQADFSKLKFQIHGSTFPYGDFFNALIAFLSIAGVVFFFVVQPLNKLQAIANKRSAPEEPTERKCPECLSDVPKAASRCKFCTAKLAPQKS